MSNQIRLRTYKYQTNTHQRIYQVAAPFSQYRVSDPMLNPVLKFVHFLDYLNFWSLFDIFLWSMCQNLCNLALVICLLIQNWENVYKSKFSSGHHGTDGIDHWVAYPTCYHPSPGDSHQSVGGRSDRQRNPAKFDAYNSINYIHTKAFHFSHLSRIIVQPPCPRVPSAYSTQQHCCTFFSFYSPPQPTGGTALLRAQQPYAYFRY